MIQFPTSDGAALLSKIKRAIDDRTIRTWSYDGDGDFTHTATQWNQSAWFRPRLTTDGITFNIFPPLKVVMSKEVYAIYHGRFIEAVLAHFDVDLAGDVRASAFPEDPDKVK